MRSRNKRILLGALAGCAGLALSLPALGQHAPESLLPPGFGVPSPQPAPAHLVRRLDQARETGETRRRRAPGFGS